MEELVQNIISFYQLEYMSRKRSIAEMHSDLSKQFPECHFQFKLSSTRNIELAVKCNNYYMQFNINRSSLGHIEFWELF